MLKMSKISPKRAPILSSIFTCYMKKLVKPFFSVPVENTLNYRSVYQNTTDFHLTYWLERSFKLRLISPRSLPHLDAINPARTPI